jgi:fluoroquinolone resistance protein
MKPRLTTAVPQPRIPNDIEPFTGTELSDALELVKVRIADADLAAVKHQGVTLEQAVIQRVLFNKSRLSGLRLFDVQCESSDLSGASWPKARWQRVCLKGCKLTGMQLTSFHGVDVLFHECSMEGMIVSGGKVKGLHFEKCRMARTVFDRVELNDVIFRDCDLAGVDLSGSQLHGVDLRGSMIPDIRIEVAQYKGVTIDPGQAAELLTQLGCTVSCADAE